MKLLLAIALIALLALLGLFGALYVYYRPTIEWAGPAVQDQPAPDG
jgi:hypothetical protein